MKNLCQFLKSKNVKEKFSIINNFYKTYSIDKSMFEEEMIFLIKNEKEIFNLFKNNFLFIQDRDDIKNKNSIKKTEIENEINYKNYLNNIYFPENTFLLPEKEIKVKVSQIIISYIYL